ncbi:GLOBIN domain-containing protein [Aphelenchoides bicaudatus]|nr:GLOBIN domain-containing protein [Aphelenchoides bicaudatus]
MACCSTMTSLVSKLPNVAKQAVNYVSNLFGSASASSRVASMDADGKPQANGKCHANGSTVTNGTHSGDNAPNTPTQKRTRSLDSAEICDWEPTPTEKEIIKLTWSDDFDFLYKLGANIYCYIFKTMPECKNLFPAIHAHGDQYRDSREFRAQALKFVQTLSHAVKNLYHMTDLAPYLSRVGERHVKFADRGFKPEYWDIFLDAMEYVLTDKIASIEQFNEEQRQMATKVWRRLAFYIIVWMKRGYFDELERQQK